MPIKGLSWQNQTQLSFLGLSPISLFLQFVLDLPSHTRDRINTNIVKALDSDYFSEEQMTNNNFSQTAAFIWSVADLLRGDFKQSQYGRIILPFTLLRRLECVLAASKEAVLAESEKVSKMNLPEEAAEKFLLRATFEAGDQSKNLSFYNTSPMNLGKMGQSDIKANLEAYVQSFSKDAREIFEHFKFDEFVGLLADANLLYKVVKKFATTDLSPKAISNHDMGLVFEELIRRFAESSNETAGEHFTPRDIVRLTTSLVFMEDDESLTKQGIIRTIQQALVVFYHQAWNTCTSLTQMP